MLLAPLSVVTATLAGLPAGLPDRGIYPDLDGRVQLAPPAALDRARAWVRVDPRHRVLTLYQGGDPLKAYPIVAAGEPGADVAVQGGEARLRAADAAELARVAPPRAPARFGAPPRSEDADGDGIVDRLDVALGAKKLLANGARYIERYVSIKYPMGDVPRSEGVCTDTVIRALRNAGIDLQRAVHEDILAAPRAYPMVEKVDASINHRRVRTVLPWFKRHWVTLPEGTPRLPGDVVFFDTFPSKPGPDHLGVVSDTVGPHGLPMVINNWTDGAVDAEMDLLSFVPVTHHFRAPSPSYSLP
jgi:uncharacterized protein YijF (DUF1287 family)